MSADRVELVPELGNGTVRWFPREDIEATAALGLSRGEFRPKLQETWPNAPNTSYVAAIVDEGTRQDAG